MQTHLPGILLIVADENLLRVSIVIPTWNRIAKLTRLLDSIELNTLGPESRETIVIADNCSDGTLEVLASRHQTVQVLHAPPSESGRLSGCALPRQMGSEMARAPFICFIDDDNIIDHNMLEVLVTALENDPSLGAVGPLMYRWPEEDELWCAGAIVTRHHFLTHLISDAALQGADEHGLLPPCDYLPNVFCTRRTTMESVPFDFRSFPHNGSEVDWALHLKSAGYQIRVSTLTRTLHDVGYGGLTTRISEPELVFDQARARVRLRRRHRDVFGSPVTFWFFWFPIIWTYLNYRFLQSHHGLKMNRSFLRGTLEGMKG